MNLICLIVAIVCFIFAAFGFNPFHTAQVAWIGMTFFAASFLPWGAWGNRPA